MAATGSECSAFCAASVRTVAFLRGVAAMEGVMSGPMNEPTALLGEGRNTAADDARMLRLALRGPAGGDGALPPVLDLPQAAAMLGLGRTAAYRLVAEQRWPTPVLRLGRLIKIPTQPLLELLRGAWPPVVIGTEQSTRAAPRTSHRPVVSGG